MREWGTSGQIRPTLGHLKYLLEKAQLFDAADFVTVDLLKQEPTRPTKGPAAPIVLKLEELEDNVPNNIPHLTSLLASDLLNSEYEIHFSSQQ